jgi:hypothetical protein
MVTSVWVQSGSESTLQLLFHNFMSSISIHCWNCWNLCKAVFMLYQYRRIELKLRDGVGVSFPLVGKTQ